MPRYRPCRNCGKPCQLGGSSTRPDPLCIECFRGQWGRDPRGRPRTRALVGCSACGKRMKRGSTGSAVIPMCLDCRRKQPGYKGKHVPQWPHLDMRRCDVCQRTYQPHHPQSRTCSSRCAKELKLSRTRNQSRLRQAMIVASRNLLDPLTLEHEAAMRRAARRCPMPGCGARLTDKPFLPNSKELDHIVPRCLGGAHTIGNTRIICRLCNARRPDDGSDVAQLDLFATIDPAALAAAVPRARRAKKPHQPRTCACGAPALRGGRRAWCSDCRTGLAARASAMRAEGVMWQDISDALGLGGPGATYNLVAEFNARAA